MLQLNSDRKNNTSRLRIDRSVATVKEHRDSDRSAANLDGDLNNINDAGAARSATV